MTCLDAIIMILARPTMPFIHLVYGNYTELTNICDSLNDTQYYSIFSQV